MPRRRHQATGRVLALGLLAASLALAACGGDSETTADETTTSTRAAAAEPSADSELRKQFNRLIYRTLVSDQGQAPKQARCAIRVLDRSVSDAELERAMTALGNTGETPQDLIDAGFEAGQECAEE